MNNYDENGMLTAEGYYELFKGIPIGFETLYLKFPYKALTNHRFVDCPDTETMIDALTGEIYTYTYIAQNSKSLEEFEHFID